MKRLFVLVVFFVALNYGQSFGFIPLPIGENCMKECYEEGVAASEKCEQISDKAERDACQAKVDRAWDACEETCKMAQAWEIKN